MVVSMRLSECHWSPTSLCHYVAFAHHIGWNKRWYKASPVWVYNRKLKWVFIATLTLRSLRKYYLYEFGSSNFFDVCYFLLNRNSRYRTDLTSVDYILVVFLPHLVHICRCMDFRILKQNPTLWSYTPHNTYMVSSKKCKKLQSLQEKMMKHICVYKFRSKSAWNTFPYAVRGCENAQNALAYVKCQIRRKDCVSCQWFF